ncbi:hypothetical protein L798_08160, partial [Zootermopsis nevadensis]
EIRRILNFRNACYFSVQNILFSHLISKNLKIKIYKTIILPFVLYGCTLRGEHRLQRFENRVLRRIFGPMREEDEVWIILHNDKLNLYSPNTVRVIKSMRWAGHVACMDGARGVGWVLVRKPGGKRPLRRPRYRWEDNMKQDQ